MSSIHRYLDISCVDVNSHAGQVYGEGAAFRTRATAELQNANRQVKVTMSLQRLLTIIGII